MKPLNNTTSNTLCIYPWIHLHAWADGQAFPCCMFDCEQPIGDIKNNSINDTINSPLIKTIRKNMLEGKENSGCEKCYKLEALGQPSMRTDGFKYYPDWKEVTSLTNNDGGIEKFQLRYLDIRYSNLCNFACVTCSPTFSSKWVNDWKKLDKVIHHEENLKLDIWEQLQPYLMTVTNVNFAGGEPLLMEDHWRIMNYWIDHDKTNQSINYTTNLSELEFKGQHVIDLWSKFKNITLLVSVDGCKETGEWIRWGQKWERLLHNINLIKTKCPKINIQVTPTVSAFNILNLFETQRLLYELAGILPNQWQLNILAFPHHLQMHHIPDQAKEQFKTLYEAHKVWLSDNNLTDNMFDSIDKNLNRISDPTEFFKAVYYAKQLDALRGTDSLNIMPHLNLT